MPYPAENDHTLGAELKRRRLALEWTQKATAKHFDVLKDSYQNWEWNDYLPHIRNRKKVVEFLGFNYWDDGTNLLSNNVLLYRIEYGLTMSELASRINISIRTIEKVHAKEKHVSKEIQNSVLKFISKTM